MVLKFVLSLYFIAGLKLNLITFSFPFILSIHSILNFFSN